MKCAIICGASFACGALGAIQLVVRAGCPDALMVLPRGAQEETTPRVPYAKILRGKLPLGAQQETTLRVLLLGTQEKTIPWVHRRKLPPGTLPKTTQKVFQEFE